MKWSQQKWQILRVVNTLLVNSFTFSEWEPFFNVQINKQQKKAEDCQTVDAINLKCVSNQTDR